MLKPKVCWSAFCLYRDSKHALQHAVSRTLRQFRHWKRCALPFGEHIEELDTWRELDLGARRAAMHIEPDKLNGLSFPGHPGDRAAGCVVIIYHHNWRTAALPSPENNLARNDTFRSHTGALPVARAGVKGKMGQGVRGEGGLRRSRTRC